MIVIAGNRKWVGSVAVTLVLLGAFIFKARREMPSYEGRSLNYWLECLPVTLDVTASGECFTKHIHYSDRRTGQTGTNALSQGSADEVAERQAYVAIKALGKKCLPV